MYRQKLTLPIIITFNELVWIIAFTLAMLCATQTTQLNDLRIEQTKLQKELDKTRLEHISQQLIGLKGQIHRVVVVVDRSGSMKYGRKWEETRTIVQTWLKYLSIQQCVLVTFNDRVDIYPVDGEFLEVGGPKGETYRANLLMQLESLEPQGNTNTLAALQRAYSYSNVDTIILFTDGFPDSGSNRYDSKMAEAIYRLCEEHGKSVPINTVGLGSYFDKRFGEFLLRIPQLTGGTFLGR